MPTPSANLLQQRGGGAGGAGQQQSRGASQQTSCARQAGMPRPARRLRLPSPPLPLLQLEP